MLEIVCVPIITALVFAIVEIYKKYVAKDKKVLVAIIPIIAGAIGVVLGIICFYALPFMISATNLGVAMLIGGASGLSATGCNQIFKHNRTLLKKHIIGSIPHVSPKRNRLRKKFVHA